MNKDLTVGNERSLLIRFCLPLLASCVCQQLYSVIDGIVVGRFISSDPAISENALAAVGASTPVTLLFLAVATGTGIGVTVLMSQLFGAKEHSSIKTACSTSAISAAALGIMLTAAGLLFGDGILKLLNTPEIIFADSSAYMKIYISGAAFMLIYNVCSGAFTAFGDSKTPLYLLLGSSVMNIALDLMFVTVFHAGVPGAAWATLISQFASAAAGAVLLIRRVRQFGNVGGAVFSGAVFRKVTLLAVPGILQQSVVAVGNLFVQSIINSYDPASIAGFFAGLKLNSFAVTAYTAVSNGVTTFTAQNFGAKKYTRVRNGIKASALAYAVMVLPVAAAFFVFAPQMIEMFLSEKSEKAVEIGAAFLRCVAPFYPVIAVKVVLDGVYRGIGKMGFFAATTIIDLVIRVALSYAFAPSLGLMGICWAWVIGWGIAAALSAAFYALSARKLIPQ